MERERFGESKRERERDECECMGRKKGEECECGEGGTELRERERESVSEVRPNSAYGCNTYELLALSVKYGILVLRNFTF